MSKRIFMEKRQRLIYLKKGDKFITKSPSDKRANAIMKITKISSQKSDGWVSFRLNKKVGRERNGKARVWWFRDQTLMRK